MKESGGWMKETVAFLAEVLEVLSVGSKSLPHFHFSEPDVDMTEGTSPSG